MYIRDEGINLGKSKDKKLSENVISFKITDELLKKLEKVASGMLDEQGRKLSPAQAARKLVIQAINSKKNS